MLDRERLQTEADYLHQALFGRPAPDDVRRQYVSVICQSPLAEMPRCDVAKLIDRGVDLEAMEAALRRKNPLNSLTQRFHTVCYLVEVRPEYFSRFVSERPSFGQGIIALGVHTGRSLYKTAKGRVLLWIHDAC